MLALVHAVGAGIGECELTFLARRPIDVERARAAHAGYCACLRACGADVRLVDVSPQHPDATFIEDTFVVLDEVAVAGAMGVASRRAEVDALLPIVAAHRAVVRLPEGATLEGGDVLRVGRTLFVGRSRRTNDLGIAALASATAELGYRVVAVPVDGCLHLKTACTAVDDETVLCNPEWVDVARFAPLRVVPVPEAEPFGGNVLRVGGALVASAAHPRTAELLTGLGHRVHLVDIGELEKAEAGVTCLALLFADRGASAEPAAGHGPAPGRAGPG